MLAAGSTQADGGDSLRGWGGPTFEGAARRTRRSTGFPVGARVRVATPANACAPHARAVASEQRFELQSNGDAVPRSVQPATRPARAELQAWNVESLRPKLALAASRGLVSAVAASALDWQLRSSWRSPW
jgi:hypothetical protein